MGKYLLKVSTTDLHGGSLDETAIPLEIVADQKLVDAGPAPESLPLGR